MAAQLSIFFALTKRKAESWKIGLSWCHARIWQGSVKLKPEPEQ